jgi:4-hydroxy-tetrahydrodipicolinate reductase
VTPRRLAIVGLGRMGSAVRMLASDAGWTIAAEIARLEGPEQLAGADVAIEFTTPDAAVGNIGICVDAGCPVVVGSTGWYEQMAAVRANVLARRAALFWAPNFSIGANVLAMLAANARRALPLAQFPAAIVETHHAAKRDAPSGTALAVARGLEPGAAITSLRVGHVPGTHEVVFDGAFEQVRLEHIVRDRRVFAEGALTAAAWLIGRHGVFTMQDMLEDTP